MTWLLSKLAGFLLPAGAIALAAALLWGGVQTHRLKVSKAETAEVHTAWALDKANATTAALAQSEKYRALETQMQAIQEQAKHDYDAAQTRNVAALAAARAGADKLRNQLAAYARASGSSTPDTAAAASDRAAKLGELLAVALQSDADRTADAESQADAVRALLAAWPHEDATISLPAMKLGQLSR